MTTVTVGDQQTCWHKIGSTKWRPLPSADSGCIYVSHTWVLCLCFLCIDKNRALSVRGLSRPSENMFELRCRSCLCDVMPQLFEDLPKTDANVIIQNENWMNENNMFEWLPDVSCTVSMNQIIIIIILIVLVNKQSWRTITHIDICKNY